MNNVPADSDSIKSINNCLSCRVLGSTTFMLIAAYFYYGCRHVKPVYYIGTPSMIFLAMARAIDLPPFNNRYSQSNPDMMIYKKYENVDEAIEGLQLVPI